MIKAITPNCYDIYDQELAELASLGLISAERLHNARQEIDEGLQAYYANLDDREPDE